MMPLERYFAVGEERPRIPRTQTTVVAQRGARTVRAHAGMDRNFSIGVAFDDEPMKLIARPRLRHFHFSFLHHHPHHLWFPPGQLEALRSVGDNWLFVTPHGFATFDDEGRRLDGCPMPTVDERLRARMPGAIAFLAPLLVWLALLVGGLAPTAWLVARRWPRCERLVVVHALVWAGSSLLALCVFALPLLA